MSDLKETKTWLKNWVQSQSTNPVKAWFDDWIQIAKKEFIKGGQEDDQNK